MRYIAIPLALPLFLFALLLLFLFGMGCFLLGIDPRKLKEPSMHSPPRG